MKVMSIRKISILGLVLTAASAVTAAVLPKSSETLRANDGTLRQNSPATTDGWTCIQRTGAQSCTLNDSGGATSASAGASSLNGAGEDSRDNTSNDALGYNTSITEL